MENIPFYYQPSGNNYVTNPLQGGQVVQITFPSSDPVLVSIDTRLSSAQPWSVMTPVQVTGSQVIRLLRHAVGQQFRLRCRVRPSDCLSGSVSQPYLSIERLRAYLYKVTFDSLPEDTGYDNTVFGGCSAYVADGKLYRNLDFKYDNAATFQLRCKDFEGTSFITGLDDGRLRNDLIAQLPYCVVDGRNNNGIMVSAHVLFNDWEWSGCGNRSIQLTRLPFLILSKVKSMATISDDLSDVLSNLSSTPALDTAGYLLQCLVTDGTTTYAVVPPDEDGASYVLVDATSNPKMSNFRYVNRSEVSRYDMDIQVRPTGIERFNMMPCELEDLRFTDAYETPDRLSEFIGIRGTTKVSTDEELEEIYDDAHTLYLDRQRDGKTWHTMHSVVYGVRMEHLYVQENWNDDCIDCQGSPDELVHEVEELAQRVTDLEEGNEPLLLYLEPDSGYLMQEGVSSGEFHINYETGYLEFES